jgi:hypothetical protein
MIFSIFYKKIILLSIYYDIVSTFQRKSCYHIFYKAFEFKWYV